MHTVCQAGGGHRSHPSGHARLPGPHHAFAHRQHLAGTRNHPCSHAPRAHAPRLTGPRAFAFPQAWTQFARLSYPACLMRCAESWAFSLMTLAAGRLPNPGTSVAAVSVSFNLYGACLHWLVGASTTVAGLGAVMRSCALVARLEAADSPRMRSPS